MTLNGWAVLADVHPGPGQNEGGNNKGWSSQALTTCALGSKQEHSPPAAFQSTVITEHAFH